MLLGLLRLPSCLCRWQTVVTALCRIFLIRDNPYPAAYMTMAFKTSALLTASRQEMSCTSAAGLRTSWST